MTAQGPLFQDYQPIPQRPGVADHAAPTGDLMARIRKFLVAVAGLAATLVSAGVFDDTTEMIVTGILAALTAAGVYITPNGRAAGDKVT